MPSIDDLYRLYKLKAAALLHDPPHKAFLMAKRESHEAGATELARGVFGDDFAPLLNDNKIGQADIMAASFDRWVLSLFMGGKYIPGAFSVTTVKLKNPLAPWLDVSLDNKLNEALKNKKVEKYAECLNKLLGVYDDWRLKYHLFYALYEPLWVAKGFPIGPADTRVPTHTIFDHNYATAAMINWLFNKDPDKVKGLMVGVDVAGVQSFIGSSRKLRDMWASSYIVSALTWYAIAELVETLGPDIVLMPSLRLNPFYLTWLRNRVEDKGGAVLDKILELAYLNINDITELHKRLGIPPYPIIPGRVTLILPPWDTVKTLLKIESENAEDYIRKRFEQGWKLLWNAAERLSEQKTCPGEGLIWKFVNSVFKYYHNSPFKESGFDSVPPLTVRVSTVDIETDISAEFWRLYSDKYRELTLSMSTAKYLAKTQAPRLKLRKITEDVFNSGQDLGVPRTPARGFEYCTSCGVMPALLVLPANEDRYKDDVKKLVGVERLEDRDVASISAVFKPGERLCPWCFLKRVVSLEPRLLKPLVLGYDDVDKFVSSIIGERGAPFGFPSTSHVASARLYEKLLEIVLGMVRDRDKDGLYKLSDLIMWNKNLPLGKVALELVPTEKCEKWWPFACRLAVDVRNIGEELKKLDLEDLMFKLYTIYSLDPEYMWFHEKYRASWEKVLSAYEADGFRLRDWLWRYYALVKADGDSIGKLLEGDVRAFTAGVKNDTKSVIKDYIEKCGEGRYSDVLAKTLEAIEGRVSIEEAAKKVIDNIGVEISPEEAQKRAKGVIDALTSVIREGRIPVTPSYHAALSSALMRAALADIALASKLDGFVVYTGGDDLLAFIPIDRALEFVAHTRLAFAGICPQCEGLELSGGFLKLNEAYIPMLASVGRSYAVYIAHYYYPLSTVINRASELLDEAKDVLKLHYFDETFNVSVSAKDVLVIAYNPRGPERDTVLPLSWHRPLKFTAERGSAEIASIAMIASKLACLVDERACRHKGAGGVLTHSFPYDMLKDDIRELLAGLADMMRYRGAESLTTIASLVRMIIERNARRGAAPETAGNVYSEIAEPLLRVKLGRLTSQIMSGEPIVGAGWFKDDGKHEGPLIINLVRAALFILSGMR